MEFTDEELDKALATPPVAFRALRRVPTRLADWYLTFIEYWIHTSWGGAR